MNQGDVPVYRYIPPAEMLGSPKSNPDNRCYCFPHNSTTDHCLGDGFLELKYCLGKSSGISCTSTLGVLVLWMWMWIYCFVDLLSNTRKDNLEVENEMWLIFITMIIAEMSNVLLLLYVYTHGYM